MEGKATSQTGMLRAGLEGDRFTPYLFLSQQREMAGMNTIDLKACLILEVLSASIPNAFVDYEGIGGLHRFFVFCQELKYELSLNELLLDACSVENIKNALRIVVASVRGRATPHRMKFGAMAAHVAAQPHAI